MHGIELKSGHNDCWWNVRGVCTHRRTQRNLDKIPAEWHRNWNSKEKCTLTQLGTQLCSLYKKELL